jgi:hypothetical protein
VNAVSRHPDEIHEWISFEHDGATWLFDVTFLESAWACIWDKMPGRPRRTHSGGRAGLLQSARTSRTTAIDLVTIAATRLTAEQWQFHRPVAAAIVDDGGSSVTALVEDACVFLNRPGFPGGAGCALHRGALEAGSSPRHWKPEVCWQLPLRLEHHEDDNGHAVATLRQWRRRDWGDGGAAFHWWCTEDDRAFVETAPVYERLGDEISALVGVELHDRLVAYLRRRGDGTPVAHPALGRRHP